MEQNNRNILPVIVTDELQNKNVEEEQKSCCLNTGGVTTVCDSKVFIFRINVSNKCDCYEKFMRKQSRYLFYFLLNLKSMKSYYIIF